MTRFNVKKTAAGTAMAGALGLGLMGLGSGMAGAAPGVPGPPVPVPPVPAPNIPVPPVQIPQVNIPPLPAIPEDLEDLDVWDGPNVNPAWLPGMPPGHNPFGPPGQVMKMQTLNINGAEVPNPFYGVPPGHWGDLNYLNPENIEWLPPGFPDVTAPLNLVWNADANQWGVFVGDQFIPFPIQLPAPPPEM